MFKARSQEIEIMDDFSQGGTLMDRTLQELQLINKYLGGYSALLKGLNSLLPDLKKVDTGQKIRIVDLGCGGGDALRLTADWSRRNGLNVQLIGIDANESVLRFAREASEAYPEIEYRQMDVFSEEFKALRFNIVLMTLFVHHIADLQLVNLLTGLRRQALTGIVINDLHRHWLAYYSILVLTKFFSKSTMVKHDGPVSVLRAFKKNELESILRKAGFTHYDLEWHWAFRYLIVLSAPASIP
ncbi:MAG: methyltransferase domain-containing protein [Bacteroidia bacterium]